MNHIGAGSKKATQPLKHSVRSTPSSVTKESTKSIEAKLHKLRAEAKVLIDAIKKKENKKDANDVANLFSNMKMGGKKTKK